MKTVRIFTDGSSIGNPGPGGWCAILSYGDRTKILRGGAEMTTNNKMELTAPIEALKALKTPCKVELYSDSSYVVKGVNEWLKGWRKKNFDKVKNPDLWKAYLEASKEHLVRAVWVRGHSGHEENERCDQIARGEAELRKR
ncbi:MAG: ribonuclease HI [Helicobacteraceae bacterium]|jgi:ribonuclease HI|nr:ribonuclease HI [Helicobacteraceae bacterium]